MDKRIWNFDIAAHVFNSWKGCMRRNIRTFAGIKVGSAKSMLRLACELSGDDDVTDSLRSMSNAYYICRNSSMGTYNTYMQLTPDNRYEPTAFGIVCFINWMKDERKRLDGAQQTFERNHKEDIMSAINIGRLFAEDDGLLNDGELALGQFINYEATKDELSIIRYKLGLIDIMHPSDRRKYILPDEGEISNVTFTQRWEAVKQKVRVTEVELKAMEGIDAQ